MFDPSCLIFRFSLVVIYNCNERIIKRSKHRAGGKEQIRGRAQIRMPLWEVVPLLPRSLHSRQAEAWRKSKPIFIKAPGQLIKPKTDKTRGRPRLSNNVPVFWARTMRSSIPLSTSIAWMSSRKPFIISRSSTTMNTNFAREGKHARIWEASFWG